MSETISDFTIGCDPEFICLNNRGVVRADHFPQRNCFGKDGGGVAFELRPDYSTDPLKVVTNIHKNLVQLVTKDPQFLKFTWKAGSYIITHPIGGHIHFGNVKGLTISAACEWLDQFVGACTVLIENKEEGLKRRNGSYGLKGDHRTNNHGFEYRTASSWLTSPYVAAAVLCLAKATIHEGIKSAKKQPPKFVTATNIKNMEIAHIRSNFDSIWKNITEFELYSEYKPQLDLIHTLVSNRRTWYPKQEMKVSWGIINLNQPDAEKPKPTLDNIWAGIAIKTI